MSKDAKVWLGMSKDAKVQLGMSKDAKVWLGMSKDAKVWQIEELSCLRHPKGQEMSITTTLEV